ncbi:MAG: dienelactone hydrolase family protein [Chloroflexi bacterium]|nr:dienelactone hydrolase family protein [Chloroflexota bacterium]
MSRASVALTMQGDDLRHQPIVRPRLSRRAVLASGLALGAAALPGCADPPAPPPLPLAGADRGNVTYRTADGIQVVATFTPPGTTPPWPAVVLMHQYQGTRAQWDDLTPDLLAAGLAVLAPDARAHGESLRRVREDGGYDFETDRANTLDGWPDDVAAAVAWLTARGDIDSGHLGVGGASVGANTAWIASAVLPEVRRAVAVSGRFEPGRLLMGEDIPNFQPRGVLFQSDREEALQSQALYSRTAEPRKVSVYDTPGHGIELLKHPAPRRDFVAWLAQGL